MYCRDFRRLREGFGAKVTHVTEVEGKRDSCKSSAYGATVNLLMKT